tara:strand:+ start:73 stop:417 length:345 start_codon:yes stop_codon:yes gene_type:complete
MKTKLLTFCLFLFLSVYAYGETYCKGVNGDNIFIDCPPMTNRFDYYKFKDCKVVKKSALSSLFKKVDKTKCRYIHFGMQCAYQYHQPQYTGFTAETLFSSCMNQKGLAWRELFK